MGVKKNVKKNSPPHAKSTKKMSEKKCQKMTRKIRFSRKMPKTRFCRPKIKNSLKIWKFEFGKFRIQIKTQKLGKNIFYSAWNSTEKMILWEGRFQLRDSSGINFRNDAFKPGKKVFPKNWKFGSLESPGIFFFFFFNFNFLKKKKKKKKKRKKYHRIKNTIISHTT